MGWQLTPYVPPLAAGSLFLSVFTAYLIRRWWTDWTQEEALAALLMATGTLWVAAHMFNHASTVPGTMVLMRKLELIAALSLPVVWLGYVCWYTNRAALLSLQVFGPLVALGVGIAALVLTDGLHGLLWVSVGTTTWGSVVYLAETPGVGYYLVLAYIYPVLVVSVGLLSTTLVQSSGLLRWQVVVLILFASIPGVAGLVEAFSLHPFVGLNIAPPSAVVTAIAGAVSVSRFRWMDIGPIARNQALDDLSDPVVVLDDEGRIVDHNPAAEALFNTAGPVIGEPVRSVFGTELPVVDAADGTITTGRSEEEGEPTVESSIGSERRIYEISQSRIGQAGAIGGSVLLFHDVTDERRATERLEEQLSAIRRLHSLAVEVTVMDSMRAIHERLVEDVPELIPCDRCRVLLADGGWSTADGEAVKPGVSEAARTAVEGNTVVTVENGGAGADGSGAFAGSGLFVPIDDDAVLQLSASEPTAFDDGDERIATLLSAHLSAVSERLAAESELRQERDRLDDFASVVSHDLRSPLSVASGYAELAADSGDPEHIERVKDAHERIEEIIEDILMLSREGRTIGEREPIPLEQAARSAWDTVDTADASFEASDDTRISADRTRFRQLFENLFRNSVEHGSTGSRTESDDSVEHGGEDVTVRIGTLEDGFYVEDDGPGIPEADRESVFDTGYSTTDGGTGFGLAIVAEIVEAHGWEIAATEGSDGGARFEIRGVE